MKALISVILCTHNPRSDYLQRTLEALRNQTFPAANWEFLLVDNASAERLADKWDIDWHPQGRHVREERIGITNARMCGIQESRGSLLVFVDDDNVLMPDYLERAVAVHSRYPFLGAYGAGSLEPEFEVPPPADLASRVGLLALRSLPIALWSNNVKDDGCIPWGAGLCVIREVALGFQELIRRFNATSVIGRRGKDLFSGEDDVFSWASVRSGRGFGVFPELRITHLISAGRVDRGYFLRLIRDHAFSHAVLRYLHSEVQPHRLGIVDFVRLMLLGLRHGLFPMRCHWAKAQGDTRAAGFIIENRLTSINLMTKGPDIPA